MNNIPEKITVFGETLVMVYLDRDTDPDNPIVLYDNLSKPKDANRCCSLHDWLHWDTNAKRARNGFPLGEYWDPAARDYKREN